MGCPRGSTRQPSIPMLSRPGILLLTAVGPLGFRLDIAMGRSTASFLTWSALIVGTMLSRIEAGISRPFIDKIVPVGQSLHSAQT